MTHVSHAPELEIDDVAVADAPGGPSDAAVAAEVLSLVPPGQRWRGCVALGLVIEPGEVIPEERDGRVFSTWIPDDVCSWIVLVDPDPARDPDSSPYAATFATGVGYRPLKPRWRRPDEPADTVIIGETRATVYVDPATLLGCGPVADVRDPGIQKAVEKLSTAMTMRACRYKRRWESYQVSQAFQGEIRVGHVRCPREITRNHTENQWFPRCWAPLAGHEVGAARDAAAVLAECNLFDLPRDLLRLAALKLGVPPQRARSIYVAETLHRCFRDRWQGAVAEVVNDATVSTYSSVENTPGFAALPLRWIHAAPAEAIPLTDEVPVVWQITQGAGARYYDATTAAYLFPPLRVVKPRSLKMELGFDKVHFNLALPPLLAAERAEWNTISTPPWLRTAPADPQPAVS